jgi:hypothetical protein
MVSQSFSGNLPACIGHVRVAFHYMENLIVSRHDSDVESKEYTLSPLTACLHLLSQTCRIAVPILALLSYPLMASSDHHPTPPVDRLAAPTVIALKDLLAMVRTNAKIEQLIWNPIAAYDQRVSAEEIHAFREELSNWEICHAQLFPDLNRLTEIKRPFESDIQTRPLPSEGCDRVPLPVRLAAAHYSFYMGRMDWALCILNDDSENNELSAYFHFYQAMRFATTRAEGSIDNTLYCSPEGLKIGFLPLLHIIGLCCPQPSWLQWIRDTCGLLQQEGVFKGHTFSTNLDCFHAFELYRSRNSPTTLDKYPAPTDRIVSQLIPEPDGRHYVSYFAQPKSGGDSSLNGTHALLPLGYARWKCYLGEHPCSPDLHMYGEMACVNEFSQWLFDRPVAVAWREWATQTEFSIDRALKDHINGARLLPPPEDIGNVSHQ